MHGPVRVPQAAGVGPAKVTVSFEAWKEGHVAASERQLSVVTPPVGLQYQEVSARLRQTLVHPDQSGLMVGLCYSADGRLVLAGHPSSGVVEVWDAVSGRQQKSIETGPRGLALAEYFQLSPEGRFLYVNHDTTRRRLIRGKAKVLYHFDCSGSLRSWDIATGKPHRDFQLAPQRGVLAIQLSPDGSRLLSSGSISGDYEPGKSKRFTTLWDTEKGLPCATFPDKAVFAFTFSPDSKTILTNAVNDKRETTALLLLDAASGKIRRSIAVEHEHRKATYRAFSPDGKQIACDVKDAASGEHCLKLWDVASGREITSFEVEKKTRYLQPIFSPDGHKLAITTLLENEKKLYLIDTKQQKIVKILSLGETHVRSLPVFSPDGKWVAMISQALPRNRSLYFLKAEELPQPRILLMEAATGEVRETIIAPPGIALSVCFSPDGKTLASGGDGRVLLWDMTTPPGARSQPRD